MTASSIEYFIREACRSLWRNAFMTFASIITVTLSLLILGIFILVGVNLNHMASQVESTVEISIYLKDDIEEPVRLNMEKKLRGLYGVSEIEFVTKDEALERFRERLGDRKDLLEALGGTNPLPASYQIRVENPDQVQAVVEAAVQMPGVDDTQFGQEIIEQIFSLAKYLRIIGGVFIVLLSFAAIFIIANTIRITVFARRREINIMKYVGATDSFIRWPFFIEGIFLGLFGAIIAATIIFIAYSITLDSITGALTFLPVLPKYPLLWWLTLGILLLGPAIGALGSMIAVKKFLKV